MGSATAVYLSAEEAAAELGVTRATLYAYVSRGRIRSVARAGTRSRLYLAEDVRALGERAPASAAAGGATPALDSAVLDSSITLIGDHALYYRGRDALRLASAQSLEAVATLLWQSSDDPFRRPAPEQPPALARWLDRDRLGPLDRAALAIAFLAPRDAHAHNFTAAGLAETGARILRHVTAAALGTQPSRAPVHAQLATRFGLGALEASWLRAALVLSADHELNASTFAVRVVASTRASLYRAVGAGLAALSGPEHGGMTERTSALLAELFASSEPRAAVIARLGRGDALPGFGHPLYAKGDPRAKLLLRLLARGAEEQRDTVLTRALVGAVRTHAGLHPTLDFALAVLAHRLELPPGSALGLFAIGRTTGWVAHALEQYATPALIRPRARYVGEHPA